MLLMGGDEHAFDRRVEGSTGLRGPEYSATGLRGQPNLTRPKSGLPAQMMASPDRRSDELGMERSTMSLLWSVCLAVVMLEVVG